MDESKQMKILKAIDDKIDWGHEMQKLKEKEEKDKVIAEAKAIAAASKKLSKSRKRKANKRKSTLPFDGNVLVTESNAITIPMLVFDNPDASWKKAGQSRGHRLVKGMAEEDGIEIDLKKTRFEIMKFGMTGMSHEEKADAETALAISLGAKPDKRSAMNYKELMEKRKKEAEEKIQNEAAMVKPKLKANKKTKTSKKAKKELGSNILVRSKMPKNKSKDGKESSSSGGSKKNFGGKRPDKRTRMNNKNK